MLADVRKRLLAAAPDGEVTPVQLERIRPRTLITLIAGVFAAYVLASQLANVSFSKLLAHANLGWSLVALACRPPPTWARRSRSPASSSSG